MTTKEPFASWSILELFGHRRLAGWLTEVELAGSGMWRIDVPSPRGGNVATQFYAPGAVYGITPCDEVTARALAEQIRPSPVTALELALPAARRQHPFVGDGAECGLCGGEAADWVHSEALDADAGRCDICGAQEDEPCDDDAHDAALGVG
jgi:hypothetical protein